MTGNRLRFNVPVSAVNEAINHALNEDLPEHMVTPLPQPGEEIGGECYYNNKDSAG